MAEPIEILAHTHTAYTCLQRASASPPPACASTPPAYAACTTLSRLQLSALLFRWSSTPWIERAMAPRPRILLIFAFNFDMVRVRGPSGALERRAA